MRWYDLFSWTYDRQLEELYRPYRERLRASLPDLTGATVLDLCCGTGQTLDLLVEAVGPKGTVIGVDLSRGMLAKASQRVIRSGWTNVRLLEADVCSLTAESLGVPHVDAVVAAMALSSLPHLDRVLDRVFALAVPGSPVAVLDVRADKLTWQARIVAYIAQADLLRPVAPFVEGRLDEALTLDLQAPASVFGGTLELTTGRTRAARTG